MWEYKNKIIHYFSINLIYMMILVGIKSINVYRKLFRCLHQVINAFFLQYKQLVKNKKIFM